MYSLGAFDQLRRFTRRNPELAVAIVRKIKWLAERADEIEHQPLQGTPFFAQRVLSNSLSP
jgi:hypothetical protein